MDFGAAGVILLNVQPVVAKEHKQESVLVTILHQMEGNFVEEMTLK